MTHEGRYHVREIHTDRPWGLWATESSPMAARRTAGLAAWLTGSRVEVWDMVRKPRVRLWSFRRTRAEREADGSLPVGPSAYEALPDVPSGWWRVPVERDPVRGRSIAEILDDPGWLDYGNLPFAEQRQGLEEPGFDFSGMDVPF